MDIVENPGRAWKWFKTQPESMQTEFWTKLNETLYIGSGKPPFAPMYQQVVRYDCIAAMQKYIMLGEEDESVQLTQSSIDSMMLAGISAALHALEVEELTLARREHDTVGVNVLMAPSSNIFREVHLKGDGVEGGGPRHPGMYQ